MLHDQLTIAGFGGQGIISLGKIIATMGMKDGKNVTHFPSYGAEMRGGTANCSVIVSDQVIYSPVFSHPSTLIVMNDPSLVKFTPMLRKDGLLIMDSSLVKHPVKREDVRVIRVPATEEANRIGNVKVANIILLGVYVKTGEFFNKKFAENLIMEYFASKSQKVIELNLKALDKGFNLV
jgi:2-oxoglutarate ferredoxin oxidoreductase subunit gamma